MAKKKSDPAPETPAAPPSPKPTPLTILKVRRTRKHVVIEYEMTAGAGA